MLLFTTDSYSAFIQFVLSSFPRSQLFSGFLTILKIKRCSYSRVHCTSEISLPSDIIPFWAHFTAFYIKMAPSSPGLLCFSQHHRLQPHHSTLQGLSAAIQCSFWFLLFWIAANFICHLLLSIITRHIQKLWPSTGACHIWLMSVLH